jgi:hypothetical protein
MFSDGLEIDEEEYVTFIFPTISNVSSRHIKKMKNTLTLTTGIQKGWNF